MEAVKRKPRSVQNPDAIKLFLMLLPFLVLIFIFSYLPLYGWRYAFYVYKPGMKLADCEFVGWYWFQSILANPVQQGEVLRVIRNTLAISGLGLLTSVVAPTIAIFLSEIRARRYKKTVQVLTTLPHFISWVLVYSVAFAMFNVNSGVVNRLLTDLGVINVPVNYLASPDNVWLKMVLWSIWKNVGWSAIIYLATIAGLDQELYEAAKVDGAGRFKQMWHITVPGILPTYLVLLVMSVSNLINVGMEQYYVFQNALNKDTIEVLDLYVYNTSMVGGSFSYATAISMLKSIVSLSLLLVANLAAKAIRGSTIF